MTIIILLTQAAVVILIGRGVFTIAFLQQQGNAFQYVCDSIIIDATCMHQGPHYSTTEADKTPFILP